LSSAAVVLIAVGLLALETRGRQRLPI